MELGSGRLSQSITFSWDCGTAAVFLGVQWLEAILCLCFCCFPVVCCVSSAAFWVSGGSASVFLLYG